MLSFASATLTRVFPFSVPVITIWRVCGMREVARKRALENVLTAQFSCDLNTRQRAIPQLRALRPLIKTLLMSSVHTTAVISSQGSVYCANTSPDAPSITVHDCEPLPTPRPQLHTSLFTSATSWISLTRSTDAIHSIVGAFDGTKVGIAVGLLGRTVGMAVGRVGA